MPLVTAKELLEAGVHFGHRTSRWNPKMRPYIYGDRNRVHIIDLKATILGIIEAYHYLQREALAGRSFLFVGTKRQARQAIRREAQRCGMHEVSERWLGGTLTNLRTIREQVQRLETLEAMAEDGTLRNHSKKMIASLNRERRRITRNLSGIRNMRELPSALIIVDPRREQIAVREAQKLGLIIIAMLDTDCDPDPIDIPLPGNDDSVRGIEIILRSLADAINAGRGTVPQAAAETGDAATAGAVSFGGEPETSPESKPETSAESEPEARKPQQATGAPDEASPPAGPDAASSAEPEATPTSSPAVEPPAVAAPPEAPAAPETPQSAASHVQKSQTEQSGTP